MFFNHGIGYTSLSDRHCSYGKISEKPTIYMSYMEIYNEVGYDLLSPKQVNTARYLEELPRITLLEDKNGEVHIRNLSVLPVTTEQEAMRILFLGDTNRTIAETPMNEYSSRSHCIFTIYLTHRNAGGNKLRFSKLHIVDLAGSERVSKSLSTGQALSEAKHINLSLHFLQQVILALSECKRSHIPYRNSMMTYILKDSLSGNSMTSMLATMAVSKNNILETISTCKFAQRVSMISTEPVINEIIDPQQEISFLKNKVEELECHLASVTSFKNSSTLTDSQKSRCQYEVRQYLKEASSDQELNILEPDSRQVQFCFSLLKNEVFSHKQRWRELEIGLNKSKTEVDLLKKDLLKRDEDIKQLKNSLDNIPCRLGDSFNYAGCYSSPQTMVNENGPRTASTYYEKSEDLFKIFLSRPENSKNISFYQTTLEKKLEMANIYAQTIKQCQKNISNLKLQLETCQNHSEKSHLIQELHEQQEIYKKALVELKEIENETNHLESGLKQEEFKVNHYFKEWLKRYEPRFSSDMPNPQSRADCTNQHYRQIKSNFFSDRPVCARQTYNPICSENTYKHVDETCRNTCSERGCDVHYNPHINTYKHVDETCRKSCSERDCDALLCNPHINTYKYVDEPCRNTCSERGCDVLHYNLHHSERNQCSTSQCGQVSRTDNIENVHMDNQYEKFMGINSEDNCECSNTELQQNMNSDNTISNYFEKETSIDFSTQRVHHESKPKIEDASVISRTLFQVDKMNIEAGNTEGNIDIRTFIGENENDGGHQNFFKETDSKEFREFMETVTLTGEPEIDEDIFNFYRTKF